jgi:predicted nuclease of predicted toxin-antitoxin system
MKIEEHKFIVDVGVGRMIEKWLVAQNFLVIAVRDLNAEMEDIDIVELANKEDAIIITMDKDFGDLIFKLKNKHKGVLLLRLEDAVAEEKLAVIQNIFPENLPVVKNNFAVYQNGKLRIRTS